MSNKPMTLQPDAGGTRNRDAATETAVQHRFRVLVVDDDPTVGMLATEALRASDFEACVVNDGRAVIPAFERLTPDIVLLDVEMPGATGYELCEQIRARPDGAHLPIVMVTGHDDTASIARAYEAGATDFFNKPILWPVLPHRIRYMIRAHRDAHELRRSEHRNRTLLQALPDRILTVDARGVVLDHLSSEAHSTGSDIVGRTLEEAFPPDGARMARECMQTVAGTGLPQSYEFDTGSGSTGRSFEVRLRLQADATFLFIVREITERRQAEARIQYLAYYDPLTALPNRQLFVRELRRAIGAAKRTGRRVAILFIDLDRFKRINDTLGHAVGDALLQSVARRLETCVRPGDFVARDMPGGESTHVRIARLGGDEFVILLADLEDPQQSARVATRVRHALAEPFTSGGHQFVVTPSIGISVFPDHGTEIEDLLVKADMAMYEAKDQGRNRHNYYRNTTSGRSFERLDLENDLRTAIEAADVTLHYQPKVDVRSGAVDAVEALLRWHHPTRGWLSPSTFIPLAEETGLIRPLGDLVIRKACEQLRGWASQGLGHLCVSVNVSTPQFASEDFVDSVLRTVREYDIEPQRLELEITESLLMRNVEEVIASLVRLRNAGIRLSIDDFGTGYSSLGYLKQFPVDTLKIDRSFVKDLHVSSDDAAICAAIIAMARELNLTTVAEGVEVVEQFEFLRRHGCHQIQGFLFSKPLPAAQLEELVRGGANLAIKPCAVEAHT
jgi:diguanylate cyclase (GGDEF)-like protein/PAS domain S-box-containing protein